MAAGEGILIFTVTFSNEAEQWRMKDVASKGKGMHFHATDVNELKLVFAAIAKCLPTLITL